MSTALLLFASQWQFVGHIEWLEGGCMGDVSKLPRWARDKLSTLERQNLSLVTANRDLQRQCEAYEQQVLEGAKSEIILEPYRTLDSARDYYRNHVFPGNQSEVHVRPYGPASFDWMTLGMRVRMDGGVEVFSPGGSPLSVQPVTSNTIHVSVNHKSRG